MIVRVFLACLRATPDLCQEQRISYLPEIGLMTCMMQAQPQLAEWLQSRPDLTVARWTCQFSDPRGVKI
jgi:hypothetical protein